MCFIVFTLQSASQYQSGHQYKFTFNNMIAPPVAEHHNELSSGQQNVFGQLPTRYRWTPL